MKKFICVLITLILIEAICVTAFAATDLTDVFDDTSEMEAVIDENVLEEFDSLLDQINIDYKLTKDDINYNKDILRTYNGINILQTENLSEENFMDILKNTEYDYEIFIPCEDKYVRATIAKFSEVNDNLKQTYKDNEEHLRELEEMVGKWIVSSCGTRESKPQFLCFKENVETFIENSNKNYTEAHIIYSLNGNIPAVAALITENSELQFKILEGEINGKKINYTDNDDTIYTLDDIKEIASQFVPMPRNAELINGIEPTTPSTNNNIIIIAASAGTAILIAAAGSIIFTKKKKAKASAELSE